MTIVYGIDFGTSQSAVMVRHDRWAEVRVKDPASEYGSPTVPSAVCLLTDGSLAVGTAAERARRARPGYFRNGFKQEFGSTVPIVLGEHEWFAHELTARLLAFLRAQAELTVPGTPDRVVITVPASWE